MIRLNKFLSDAGVASRRGADKLIAQGRVKVDGQVATMGMQVDDSMEITVGKKVISGPATKVVLMYNKPRGVVCTEDKRDRHNIIRVMNYPERITYAGRLDKDSEGLMIMTNDGDLINHIMRARNHHEKEYQVTVDKEIDTAFKKAMESGVHIFDEEKRLDAVTRPAKVEIIGKNTFTIVLTQGLNRQIRRMCSALGFQVKTLRRTRIMNLELGSLPVGEYRKLRKEEIEELYGEQEESPGNGAHGSARLPFK
ncbi:23S rRNA pseudouridine2604 synthase [Lachnospiraceae bacterium PF1-21]|uniref:Pseudouridine synthase n=1 Tax=Ohessyouella blattaphilus TaxID=2949333 RepID=A0ABT1EGD4_9FIRM|nr:pseudouridine synthase [Ohessyouella blattaphilus]MCP1108822.1 rRNA pseudouridine synthase [Ohessyouella blattaphilus]MCR8562216.1 rRNA pseudouridine synthase [Ohessyouella blattaphilus]MDL2249128.1 rRNA pseudouridine synthase [Lachnospiraceae bacterium OttesenSCG-928-J05]